MKMGTRGLDSVSDGEVLVQSSVLECTFVDSGIPPTVTGLRVRAVILPKFKNSQSGQVPNILSKSAPRGSACGRTIFASGTYHVNKLLTMLKANNGN